MDTVTGRVLLLNKSWIPINVIDVKRAMRLLFGNLAKVVDHRDYSTYDFQSWADLGKVFEDGEFILTPRFRIPIPDVLVLDGYNSVPTHRVSFTRNNLYKRDGYSCQFCGDKPSISELTIDHVVPKAAGGRSTWTNCVIACIKCNRKKSDKSLEESGLTLRSVPYEPAKRKMMMLEIGQRKVSWDKFITNKKIRDVVASEVYWNAELID